MTTWITILSAVIAAAPDVKVMSYNIRYGTAKDGVNHWDKRQDFLIDTIRAYDPDLLGTQETLGFQRDFLAEKLPTHGVFGVGRDDGQAKGEMMALYWRKDRFEKLDGGHFWLSETPNTPGSKSWDSSLPRMATWVKLRDTKNPAGKPVLFLNTHFDHLGKQARNESAKLIRSRIEELGRGCSVVVTGDFNTGEGTEPYVNLFGQRGDQQAPVVDTFRQANPVRGRAEGTANGFEALKTSGSRIDWIGASRDWAIRSANIDRTSRDGRTPSDHFAVTAVLSR